MEADTSFPWRPASAAAPRSAVGRRTNCRTRRRRRRSSGVRPSLATTSSFAPLSNRYCTTLFAPRYAAACIAVSPRSLTALTSAPSSSTSSLTASSTWLSDARSWFEAQAMPAAAISGVMLLFGADRRDRRRARAAGASPRRRPTWPPAETRWRRPGAGDTSRRTTGAPPC